MRLGIQEVEECKFHIKYVQISTLDVLILHHDLLYPRSGL